VKEAAAVRWVDAVNADGRFGTWRFRMANNVADVSYILNEARVNPHESTHNGSAGNAHRAY